jgi:curved DNA-binding protein
MDYKDYYSILGVDKNADAKKIKKEYRKQARKYHPDVNHNDAASEKRFKDIGEAYEVLKDPEKRKAYDQHGSNWKNGPQQQRQQQQYRQPGQTSGGGGFDFGGDSSGGEYSDFFESMFGGGRRGGGGGGGRSPFQQKGEDVDASISIPLEDAYHGSSRTITFSTPVASANGQMENKKRTLNVKVPKGIKNGGKIRLKGQGSPGHNGGAAGDMYIRFDIDKHRLYDVEGIDVFLTLPIAPWEAALGAKVNVPTPAGTIKMNIPEGANSGKKMKLKGKGIPAKKVGDLFVELQIVLPPAESDKARDVYKEMQELNFNPRPHFGV